ncbi:hypothetical protein RclHR1_02810023 [Rhizophagus clarus]|uniref:Uncharacterized protein n=1 Tax=Rhizophagus clarus TaxID=94130 RepID=A0A140D083_9GLOM|nr:hypothetical protein [Rhizophagus clarus]GBB96705.1 hypothetical protein RclHR1_02810023 [Rhizophagus clarus]GES74137.1 hypothetical protein GLOIN_2v1585648 [Rhizophagus clarus]
MLLIYIVNTLKVLANVFLYFIIVVALIALAWIILWKLILNQVSFIREIAGLPKLNNKPPQQQILYKKKRRQSSTSSSTTHSKQQSISSTHSKQQSISSVTYGRQTSPSHNRQQSIQQHNNIITNNPIIHQRTFSSSVNQNQGGGSVSMSRKISSSTNKTYQSQDDTTHKNYHHTKSDSKTSIKSFSSSKILPTENDENLNFEEGYIS